MQTPERDAAPPRTRIDYRLKAAILALLIGGGITLALTTELPDPASLRDQVAAAGAFKLHEGLLVFARERPGQKPSAPMSEALPEVATDTASRRQDEGNL